MEHFQNSSLRHSKVLDAVTRVFVQNLHYSCFGYHNREDDIIRSLFLLGASISQQICHKFHVWGARRALTLWALRLSSCYYTFAKVVCRGVEGHSSTMLARYSIMVLFVISFLLVHAEESSGNGQPSCSHY